MQYIVPVLLVSTVSIGEESSLAKATSQRAALDRRDYLGLD